MRLLPFLTTIISLAAVALASSPAANIQSAFRKMLRTADSTLLTAQSIDVVNARLAVLGEGPYPVVSRGLTELRYDCNDVLEIIEDTLGSLPGGLDPAEDAAVADAYHQSFTVVVSLINTLMEKATIVDSLVSFGASIATPLRHLRLVVVAMSDSLARVVDPASQQPITSDKEAVVSAIDQAIPKYSPVVEL